MNINFIAILANDYTIEIYDLTDPTISVPNTINSMTLDITSSVIPNGQISNRLDLIAYLRNQTKQSELYTITSEVLGFSSSIEIPDGVYHFYYSINNTYTKEHSFLIYNTVEKAVNRLLEDVNYKVNVGNYDIEYVGDTSEYDIEQVRLAVTLLDSLKAQTQEPNEVAVNDTLDKLTRLLGIINNNI